MAHTKTYFGVECFRLMRRDPRQPWDTAPRTADPAGVAADVGVRSERPLTEEIDYSVLFRWFVGMNTDEPGWDVTVFTKNRHRL
jgi:hypothetical protein